MKQRSSDLSIRSQAIRLFLVVAVILAGGSLAVRMERDIKSAPAAETKMSRDTRKPAKVRPIHPQPLASAVALTAAASQVPLVRSIADVAASAQEQNGAPAAALIAGAPSVVVNASQPAAQASSVDPSMPLPLPPNANLAAILPIEILTQNPQLDLSNPTARAALVKQVKAVEDARLAVAWEKARALGIPTKGTRADGGGYVLRDFRNGRPIYDRDENVNAAVSTAADLVRWTTPYNVDGSGWLIGLWEAGGIPRVSHQEFLSGRAAVIDGATGTSSHATHVAGTMIAAGYNPAARGMAPGGAVWAYSSTNDYSEMLSLGAATAGEAGKINLSNHSYGNYAGWDTDTGRYVWYGTFIDDGTNSDDAEQSFGQYGNETATIDAVVTALPFYLPFISAGNHRGDPAPSSGSPWFDGYGGTRRFYVAGEHPLGDGSYKSGYDTMEGDKLGKNVIAVGAVNDAVSGGVRSVGAATLSNFTSTGPADDGRIKPDIVANGVSLTSCTNTSDTATTSMSGTSMASPNACGSALLVQQYFSNRFPGQRLRADMMKGLLIHTANDLGTAGPDYLYGWGLMNTKAAADVVKDHANATGGAAILTGAVSAATTSVTHTFHWDGTKPLRATLCWIDPAGATQSTHDSRARALVNDLNLTVQRVGSTTHFPYVMPYVGNWTNAMLSAPATTGVNTVDNVEQVYLAAPISGDYVVTVNYAGALQGPSQNFALIVTGQAAAPEITVQQPAGTDLTDGVSSLAFGSVNIGAASAAKTVWVINTGTANLNLTSVANFTGSPGDFVIDATGMATVLTPGGSTSFKVTFVPTVATARSTTLRLSNNDSDENPFDIPLSGTGVPADGDLSSLALSTGTLNPTFNTAVLNYETGVSAATATITVLPTARQATATISVNGTAVTSGTSSGPISLAPGATTITIAVTANSTTKNYVVRVNRADAPEIVIEQPAGTSLTDSGSSVDFGTGIVGVAGFAKTFTVRNTGTVPLTGLTVSKTGANSADFTITQPFTTTLAANASATFTAAFTAGASGARTAGLQVSSSDTDENPFDITLTGTGASPLAQMMTPIPGGMLGGTTVTFNWSAGTGVTNYALWIGNSLDAYDIYAGDEGTNRSRTLTLPDDGRTLYVTLWSWLGGLYQPVRYTYRALLATKAQITSPTNGSTLSGPTLALAWSPGASVSQYALWVGTTPGGYDVYAGLEGLALSHSLPMPTTGAKIYVTLHSMIRGAWQSNSYQYTLATGVPRALTSPANGAMLGGSSVSLTWDTGMNVTATYVWVGSSYGGYDLGSYDVTGLSSKTVSVPADGGLAYVTLWSLIDGAFQSRSYYFSTMLPLTGAVPARLVFPSHASTATTSPVIFNWDSGSQVTQYALWIGSAPDAYDLYAGLEGTGHSRSVTLPGDGRRIYVTLHSMINGAWQSNSYYFTDFTAPPPVAAQITSQASGDTLTGASLPLVWNQGSGLATQYALWVGRAPNGYELYSGLEGTNLSRTINVPVDGGPIYVTLWSFIKGAWQQNAYWFNTADQTTTERKARLTSPANGTTLASSTVTLDWDAGLGVSTYALWIGSSPRGYDLVAALKGTTRTHTVATLPTDGRKIYVTVWSLIGGVYKDNGYWFTAVNVPRTKAAMISPAAGGTFASSSQTFTWSAGSGATNYAMWIGRKPGAYDVYAGIEGLSLSKTVTTLPLDGGPVYVTLWTLLDGAYQGAPYIYNAAPPP